MTLSLNSHLYFQRYAPDKLFIAKIKKGSNSVNTTESVTVVAFCTFADSPLSPIKFHLVLFYTFRDMIRANFLLQKLKKGSHSVSTADKVVVLAIFQMALYQCIKYH